MATAAKRPKNTFERHFESFIPFVKDILGTKPDYLVPVAKKGCKLLKSSGATVPPSILRYRAFFEYEQLPLKGKHIAVLDDATQYTASLKEHRSFFESQGAYVKTYSFVGHESLFTGERERYDAESKIHTFLREPVYQEYILQQSYHLLNSGHHFDLDHIVFETQAIPSEVEALITHLSRLGTLIPYADDLFDERVDRFSLDHPDFFRDVPFLHDPNVTPGNLRKLKFAYERDTGKLFFSPLVFPTWHYEGAEHGAHLFADTPFPLPFPVPTVIDTKNPSALRRAYFNLTILYTTAFAKAFLQALTTGCALRDISMRHYDLDATIGPERALKLTRDTLAYLTTGPTTDFTRSSAPTTRRDSEPEYDSFAALFADLKEGYKQLVKRRGSRLGVHYIVPYDELFQRYGDATDLSANLDYYCDFGAIVPETIIGSTSITRGCRTGEPEPSYGWQRTSVLIPLVIQNFIAGVEPAQTHIPPMTLHKLLANFNYDYPHEQYKELHCLLPEAHRFGTLMRVYHHLHARSKPSLYEHDRISGHYIYDRRKRAFRANSTNFVQLAKSYFDDEQQVSYATIYTYFQFMRAVFRHFGGHVDILNLLSLCRDQNYFYTHILYNIHASYEGISSYMGSIGRINIDGLHAAATEASSGLDKVDLYRRAPTVLRDINQRFEDDLQFLKVLERITQSYIAPDASFLARLDTMEEILRRERITANYALLVEATSSKRTNDSKIQKYRRTIARLLEEKPAMGVPDFVVRDDLPHRQSAVYAEQLQQLAIEELAPSIESLPEGEELLATRLTAVARKRARNILTRHIEEQRLTRIALLYIDLSGLRVIPPPKETVVAEYYRAVERAAEEHGGQLLYGGKGGDDAYTFLFRDPAPAIATGRGIRRSFAENIFLARVDVKFGLSFRNLPAEQKETEAILAWGEAKDCCEYKGLTFRNRGDLLLGQRSRDDLTSIGHSITAEFDPIPNEAIKSGEAPQPVYKLRDFR
jgi:hypothetical protein